MGRNPRATFDSYFPQSCVQAECGRLGGLFFVKSGCTVGLGVGGVCGKDQEVLNGGDIQQGFAGGEVVEGVIREVPCFRVGTCQRKLWWQTCQDVICGWRIFLSVRVSWSTN